MNEHERMVLMLRERAVLCLKAALAKLARSEEGTPTLDDWDAATEAKSAATALELLAQIWCENEP